MVIGRHRKTGRINLSCAVSDGGGRGPEERGTEGWEKSGVEPGEMRETAVGSLPLIMRQGERR